jgi:hypothetical protein
MVEATVQCLRLALSGRTSEPTTHLIPGTLIERASTRSGARR